MKTQSYMNVSYFVVVSMLSFILDPHPKKNTSYGSFAPDFNGEIQKTITFYIYIYSTECFTLKNIYDFFNKRRKFYDLKEIIWGIYK